MRIVNTSHGIIDRLQKSGISNLMKSLESCDWLVIEEEDNEIIGAAGIGGFFHFSSIQLIKEFQNRGIGKKLQAELINESKNRNYSYIMVLFNPENTASSNLHNSLGYKKIFRMKYSKEYVNDVCGISFKKNGSVFFKILKLFNKKIGMFFLALTLKIFKPFFRQLLGYNEKNLPTPNIRWIIKNFEKI
mgnify:CR=1 FL=1